MGLLLCSSFSLIRERFFLLLLYNLFLLSLVLCVVPPFFSVEGSTSLVSQVEPPLANELNFGSSSSCLGFQALCPDSASLCFSSARFDFAVQPSHQHEKGKLREKSSSFSLVNGGVVTCSSQISKSTDRLHKSSFGGYNMALCQAPLTPNDWMKASNDITTNFEEGIKDAEIGQLNRSPSSLNIDISPSLLDWSMTSLYVASISTLTLTNLHKDSVLVVYEPYCTDPQFYPYNFDELSIEPGENTTISFIFLPRNLGLISAKIVLQTNFGGFVLQVKGIGIESPYNIEPLVGIDLHTSEVLSKTLSIHNPFEESIYVEEVGVWMSDLESVSKSNHAVCKLDVLATSSSEVEWFNIGNEWKGLPRVDLRPLSNWEILPKNGDAIVELRFQTDSQGKVIGAICLKLRHGVTQTASTVVVPLEVQMHDNPNHSALMDWGSVSASFNSHMACDGSGLIFTLYFKNDGSDSLSVVNIFEESQCDKMYEIKYVKNLVLFPTSTTAIALISFKSRNTMPEINGPELQCDVVIETNHSSHAFLRIPCQDFTRTPNANVGASNLGLVPERQQEELMNEKRTLGRILEDSCDKKISPFEEVEASNLILANWISHGKAAGSSLLINQLVVFPPVKVGSHFSQTITVKNPGPFPALVQLVLNSEELITDCKTSEDESSKHTFLASSSDIGSFERKFGFALPESGLMALLLHPFESASLGPVIFRPSNRCTWSSSALIRSNVSGIEWVSLYASGGSHSISLRNGSKFWRIAVFLFFSAIVLAVMVVLVRVMPLSMTLRSNECYFRLDGETCAGQDDMFFHRSTKAPRSVTTEQKKQKPPPFMSNYPVCQSAPKQFNANLISADQLKNSAMPSYSPLKPTKDSVPTPVDAAQTDNSSHLTIKVVREKGKRKKKCASSNNSKLAAKLEVSSSHSSNSTPSSPLSPSGSTPKQASCSSPDNNRTAEAFRPVAPGDKVNITKNIENEPSNYPSLVFSGPLVNESFFLAKSSPIAPHKRAPGPKMVKEKSVKREENEVSAKQFTYDMWADRFGGHVMCTERRDADYSKSFFAVQPQASPNYSGNLDKSAYDGNVTGVS